MADWARAEQGERAKRAWMARRIHRRLHDAGLAGTPITGDDALGPDGDPDAYLPVDVVARFMNGITLDEGLLRRKRAASCRDEGHGALTKGMRGRVDESDALARGRAALAGAAAEGSAEEGLDEREDTMTRSHHQGRSPRRA